MKLSKIKPLDRLSIYRRFVNYVRDSHQAKTELRHGPRNLAEALNDSGALAMPSRDRFTGGW